MLHPAVLKSRQQKKRLVGFCTFQLVFLLHFFYMWTELIVVVFNRGWTKFRSAPFPKYHLRVGPHWCISNGFNWVPFQREIDNAHISWKKRSQPLFMFHHQVKMFGVVVAIFMVCWAPYHIYFIVSYHFPHIARKEWISNVYLAVRPSLWLRNWPYPLCDTKYKSWIQ